jgi:hypothetical protein
VISLGHQNVVDLGASTGQRLDGIINPRLLGWHAMQACIFCLIRGSFEIASGSPGCMQCNASLCRGDGMYRVLHWFRREMRSN